MDTYPKKWTKTQQDVFSYLCTYAGKKLSQRDIAKALNKSPTAVGQAVHDFVQQRLVQITLTKTIHFVALTPQATPYKQVENLKNIYDSGLHLYLEQLVPASTSILFGSFARGEDILTSDIDIAIIGRPKKQLLLKTYEQFLHRPINVQFFHDWSKIHRYLRNNILNGIVLHGSVDL